MEMVWDNHHLHSQELSEQMVLLSEKRPGVQMHIHTHVSFRLMQPGGPCCQSREEEEGGSVITKITHTMFPSILSFSY